MSVPPTPTPPTPTPYGPYGGGPWTPPRPPAPKLNGLAVAALVLALTVCLAPLGLVFGIVALVQTSRRARRGEAQRGRGLAVAAVAVSGSLIVLGALLAAVVDLRVWTLSSPERGTDGKVEKPSAATVVDLRKGDCFTPKSGLPTGEGDRIANSAVELVPCDRPHRGEVYGIARLEGPAAFPGTAAVAAQARTRCAPLLLDHVADPDGQRRMGTFFYHPDETGWQAGRRTVLCWVSGVDGQMTSSVRQDMATMEPGQGAYLTAIRPLTTVLLSRPVQGPEEDLAGVRAWSRAMPGAIDETARRLDSAPLPPAARAPAAALAAELRASRPGWVDAGTARNVAEFREALTEIGAHPNAEEMTRLRTALGLPVAG